MSKLQELIDHLCPNGVEFKSLSAVMIPLIKGTLKISDLIENGKYPVINSGRELYGYYDRFNNEAPAITIAARGEYAGWVSFFEERFWAGGLCYPYKSKDETKVATKFIYYWLKNQERDIMDNLVARGSIPALNKADIDKYSIPIPPIEVQDEIVKILDRFADYAAELQAELQARKEQYEYYRNLLLTFNSSAYGCGTDGEQEINVTTWGGHSYEIQWKTMGEIGTVKMCKRIMKNQTSSMGEIPFYKIGTFGKEPDAYISRELFQEYKSKYSFPSKGTILISAAGTIGRCVVYDGEDAYFQDSNIVWLENDEKQVLNSYLYHFYQIVEWDTDGGTIKRLYNDRFLATPIPIPPLELQEKIVAILDRFETLVNDLSKGLPAEIEAVKARYEYYRNKLLTFNPLSA